MWPSLRVPPVLLAAVGLAAGIAAGLRWAGGTTPAVGAAERVGSSPAPEVLLAWLVGAAAAVVALRAEPVRGPRPPLSRRSRVSTWGALAACIAAGWAGGAHAGSAAVVSCLGALADGEPVAAAGALDAAHAGTDAPWLRRAGEGAGSPTARAGRAALRDVTLVHAGRRCRVPVLVTRLDRPDMTLAAGTRVAVTGRWRTYEVASRVPGARSAPRPLETIGSLRGAVLATAPARGGAPLRRWRAAAARRLEARLPPDAVPMARALTLAERGDLEPETVRRFADAGLVHLLAISGMHIGIFAAGAVWAVGLALGPGRARWLTAAGLTAAYVVAIGAPPSAVRAALLLVGYAAARVRGAPARLGDLAGVAAAAALVTDPSVLLRPGFQLSFAGFAGVVAGDRAARRLLDPGARRGGVARADGSGRAAGGASGSRARSAARALGAGTGAFLLTAPLAAAHFERVAPAAIVSNLAGAPLLGLALAALGATLLLPGPAARLAGDAAAGALRLLDGVAARFAALPLHGRVEAPDASGWACLLLLLLALAILVMAARRIRALVPAAGALSIWLGAPGLTTWATAGATLLCHLDVGQGDAAVVRTRGGRWIVLDAGPGRGFEPGGRGPPGDAGRRVVAPFLRSRGARSVELFALSHPHLDHLGGAAALFERFPVRRVLDAAIPAPSAAYLAFLDAVAEEGAVWHPAREGARLRVDEVELLVLGPEPSRATAPDDLNEASVAVRLRMGDFTYLNTGDASAEIEAGLLVRWPADSLRADLLKLGHHGSRTSSGVAWLRATAPTAVVVSVGRGNRYGHPHPVTLARLDSAGVADVWRTDRDGTLCIAIRADGSWRHAT